MDKNEVLAFLGGKRVWHEVYDHAKVFTVDESRTIHLPHDEARAQNLFLTDEKGGFFLVTLPDEKRIDLKSLQRTITSNGSVLLWKKSCLTFLGLKKDR